MISEPAYEVAAFIRNPMQELLNHEDGQNIIHNRVTHFAKIMELPSQRIIDWCFVQAVLAWAGSLEDGCDTTYFEKLTKVFDGMIFRIIFLIIILLTNQAIAFNINGINMDNKVIIWDNDGTITGSKDPNDKTPGAKIILPNVKQTMETAKFNFVISGFKSPESEVQNFDPEVVAGKFIKLMQELPINAVAFSPTIGGVACYVVIKKNDKTSIIKAHEDPRYSAYIGKFKKPDIGMFQVIKDIALSEFGTKIDAKNSIMIGDTWHDKHSAESFGIPFLEAKFVHSVGFKEKARY